MYVCITIILLSLGFSACSRDVENVIEEPPAPVTNDHLLDAVGTFNTQNREDMGNLLDRVHCIFIDGNRELWLGGETGICKYDGKNFYKYVLDVPNAAPNSSTASVGCLAFVEESSKGLYTAYDSGLRFYNYESDVWEGRSINGLEFSQINCMADDGNGNAILGGLNTVYLPTDTETWSDNFVGEGNVTAVAKAPDGAVWATLNGSLVKLANGNVETFTPEHVFQNALLHSVAVAQNGDVWVASDTQMFSLRNGKWMEQTLGGPIPEKTIKGMIMGQDQQFWAYGDGGIWIIDQGHWTLFLSENSDTMPQTIDHIYLDDDNNVWIASNRKIFTIKQSEVLAGNAEW